MKSSCLILGEAAAIDWQEVVVLAQSAVATP